MSFLKNITLSNWHKCHNKYGIIEKKINNKKTSGPLWTSFKKKNHQIWIIYIGGNFAPIPLRLVKEISFVKLKVISIYSHPR